MTQRTSATGRYLEYEVIEKLRNMGIHATFGRYSPWKWVDIVAWGCVRIEVKTAQFNDGKFQFRLTQEGSTHEGWNASDLVLLICRYGDENNTFHLFRRSHPVFYRPDGTVKTGVVYRPGGNPIKPYGHALSDLLMARYQDRWEMIEHVRRTWSRRAEHSLVVSSPISVA